MVGVLERLKPINTNYINTGVPTVDSGTTCWVYSQSICHPTGIEGILSGMFSCPVLGPVLISKHIVSNGLFNTKKPKGFVWYICHTLSQLMHPINTTFRALLLPQPSIVSIKWWPSKQHARTKVMLN